MIKKHRNVKNTPRTNLLIDAPDKPCYPPYLYESIT